MKQTICLILALIMALSISVPAAAVEEVSSFSDVAESHWAHDSIMAMVEVGLFEGTTAPVNGVGTFDPTGTMTRAQFITVITRYLYGGILENMAPGKLWYSNNYDLAVSAGIITESEIPFSTLKEGIPRQEMAMIMVRAAEKQGEFYPGFVPASRIPDYNSIDSYYSNYVRKCFAMGMIKGTDASGTFAPQGTVTRAQGAMVLYRLINADVREPETRLEPDFTHIHDGTDVQDYVTDVGVNYTQMYADWAANQTPMTITYGKARYNRPAIAGDTYIKKDGTSIVLKMGPSGVVGEGQGVSADLLLVWGSDQVRDHIVHGGGQFRYDNTAIGDDQCGLTSTGAPLMGQTYQVNATTGEGHFSSEWSAIMSNPIYTKYIAGIDGEYRGQVSSDPMHLWVWDGSMWVANYTGYKWN